MATYSNPASPPLGWDLNRLTGIAGLFWLFTFALLSLRSGLVEAEAFELLAAPRFIAVTAGALIFWVVLRAQTAGADRRRLNPGLALATILPASLAVLGVRLLSDSYLAADPRPLDHDVRWVLVWAGYFGLWVSAAIAFRLHRGQVLAAAAGRSSPPLDSRDVDALIDALALELVETNPCSKDPLHARLAVLHGYELADQADPDSVRRAARAELIDRLTLRLAAGDNRLGRSWLRRPAPAISLSTLVAGGSVAAAILLAIGSAAYATPLSFQLGAAAAALLLGLLIGIALRT
jgi:hypothetical protein